MRAPRSSALKFFVAPQKTAASYKNIVVATPCFCGHERIRTADFLIVPKTKVDYIRIHWNQIVADLYQWHQFIEMEKSLVVQEI